MWASGQRPLAKRQKEAFIAFVAERMTEAYAPLKATLAAGIARAHPLPEMVSPPNLEHGPGFTDYELAALVLIEHALPEDTPARQAYNHAMKQIIFMRECLAEWDLELREGDGSLYHELAEALRTLRECIFLNEAELRAAMTPAARNALWEASTTITRCVRTLETLGLAPEVEQLRQQMTTQTPEPVPLKQPPVRSRRTPAGSSSTR